MFKMSKKIAFFLLTVFVFNACLVFCGGTPPAAKEIRGFVRVQDVEPDIAVELRYAAENNFTGKKIYPVAVCLLRKETAQKLAAANKEFMKKGFRSSLWDAYRPPYVQKVFWRIVAADRSVAKPAKGGRSAAL